MKREKFIGLAHQGVEPLPQVHLHHGEQDHQGVEPLPQVHLQGPGDCGVPGTVGSRGLRGPGNCGEFEAPARALSGKKQSLECATPFFSR